MSCLLQLHALCRMQLLMTQSCQDLLLLQMLLCRPGYSPLCMLKVGMLLRARDAKILSSIAPTMKLVMFCSFMCCTQVSAKSV